MTLTSEAAEAAPPRPAQSYGQQTEAPMGIPSPQQLLARPGEAPESSGPVDPMSGLAGPPGPRAVHPRPEGEFEQMTRDAAARQAEAERIHGIEDKALAALRQALGTGA